MRTLGLDIGDRRIGIAISDPGEILATPLATITREDDQEAIDYIIQVVDQRDVGRIVIGLPYSLDGSIGGQANKVIDFAKKFSRFTKAEIEIWDERLSTVAAERILRESGTKRARKRAKMDSVAAAFILQGYLDSLKVYD